MSTTYIQKRILGVLVTDLLAAGYVIDVNDNNGDRETHVKHSADHAAIMAAIFNPEIDADDYCLDIFKAGNGHHVGWVRIIDGNGVSVISDYTTNLEEVLKGASALADKIDGHETEWLETEMGGKVELLDALKTLLYAQSDDRNTAIARAEVLLRQHGAIT